jgi:hypothetical protein
MNHLKPTELYLGIESGFYSPEEAITWADDYLLSHDYNDNVANIAMAENKSPKEMLSLLSRLAHNKYRIEAIRPLLCRMSEELEKRESIAIHIVKYCEKFWVEQGYELPDDMQFMGAVEDEFYLATEGLYWTKGEALERLKKDLAKFRN